MAEENDNRNPDLGTEKPETSSMEDGAIPKAWRPGCGCLCCLIPYYVFGLLFLDGFRWSKDWPKLLAYLFGPFLWPVLVGGWMPFAVLQVPVALAAVCAYWYWIRKAWKADDLKWTFLNLLWIVFLLILSVGGCAMAVDRSLDI